MDFVKKITETQQKVPIYKQIETEYQTKLEYQKKDKEDKVKLLLQRVMKQIEKNSKNELIIFSLDYDDSPKYTKNIKDLVLLNIINMFDGVATTHAIFYEGYDLVSHKILKDFIISKKPSGISYDIEFRNDRLRKMKLIHLTPSEAFYLALDFNDDLKNRKVLDIDYVMKISGNPYYLSND